MVGRNNGAYGYYNLSGGNVSVKEFAVGSGFGNATGMMDMTGGSLTVEDYFFLTRGNADQKAVVNVTGGTLQGNSLTLDPGYSHLNSGNKYSVMTISDNGKVYFRDNGFGLGEGWVGRSEFRILAGGFVVLDLDYRDWETDRKSVV